MCNVPYASSCVCCTYVCECVQMQTITFPIRYFEYDSVLKDYIILDPLTLVRLMTTVISLKV